MAKKIDPLNKKNYGAVSAMLTVSDVKKAAAFYQKAFGFTKRGIMNGPDGKPMFELLNTITFADRGGKTEMTAKIRAIRITGDAAFPLAGMTQGWIEMLERLQAFLES